MTTKENRNHYDVIVVGGGLAGSAAAIASARQEKKTLLIEKYNALGGAAVYNLVNPFMPYWTRRKDTHGKIVLSEGIFKEILGKLSKLHGLHKNGMSFNEEILKYVLMETVLQSGAELLFQSRVTRVSKVGAELRAVTVSNVSGESEYTADYFIDATGDADISFLAGFPYRLGRESDGLCQPMTLCFRLGNVKIRGVKQTEIGRKVKRIKGTPYSMKKINELYREYQKAGKISDPREDVLMFGTMAEGVYHFNTTRVIRYDPTNASDITRAEIAARRQIFEIYDFLRNNFCEFSESVLLSSGIQIGVRESRMIDGEYVLTQEDLLRCAKFEDSVAVCNYDIDIHNPDGSGTSHCFFKPEEYYTIPYRCLVPKGSENLLVAGRCISVTHEAQASVRIMPTCCTIGEAAGVAAATAHSRKTSVRNVNISALRETLLKNGARID